MTLLNPMGLLLLGGIPLVILIHLFTRRRRRLSVSSLRFWRTVRHQRKPALLMKLVQNLNLLLQVLAVALLALASSRPAVGGPELFGVRQAVLVIDTSASMHVEDSEGARIDRAKARARSLVSKLPRRAEARVLEAGARTRLSPWLPGDSAELRDAIDRVDVTDTAGNMEQALSEAIELMSAGTEGRIYVFSDGAFTLGEGLRESIGSVRFDLVAEPSGAPAEEEMANQGIVAFAVRGGDAYGGSVDAAAGTPNPGGYQILVTVRNTGNEAVNRDLVLRDGERELQRREVTLEPDGDTRVFFERSGAVPQHFSVRLEGADPLPVDDVAYGAAGSGNPARVLMVGRTNLFLESFLRIHPSVRLVAGKAASTSLSGSDYDLLVANEAPPVPLSRGAYLLVDTAPKAGDAAGDGQRPGEPRESPRRAGGSATASVSWNRNHPIMREVDLSGLTFFTRSQVSVTPQGAELGTTPLIRAGGTVKAVAMRAPELRAVSLGFGLFESNFSLLPAFPVFLDNALRWLLPAHLSQRAHGIRAGEEIPLATGTDTQTAIRTPGGKRITAPSSQEAFGETDEAGIYELRSGGDTRFVAVNLLSHSETEITPRFVPPETATERREEAERHTASAELALIALVMVFLLLLTDVVVWGTKQ